MRKFHWLKGLPATCRAPALSCAWGGPRPVTWAAMGAVPTVVVEGCGRPCGCEQQCLGASAGHGERSYLQLLFKLLL